MYAKTADKIYGPLIMSGFLRPEFADNDGSGSAWAYSLGSLDAPDYIPLGGVAEDIYGSSRCAGQLRGNRDSNLRFPIKATAAEQETYRLHCELRTQADLIHDLVTAAEDAIARMDRARITDVAPEFVALNRAVEKAKGVQP